MKTMTPEEISSAYAKEIESLRELAAECDESQYEYGIGRAVGIIETLDALRPYFTFLLAAAAVREAKEQA